MSQIREQGRGEDGQAILIVVLAMSIFLLGAVGLAVDGAHLYSQRQMAQTAADGAAQAGIMSIFDGTNGAGTAAFSTAGAFTCGTTDAKTPCVYAKNNGFGGSVSDTVTIDFPPDTAAPGVAFAPSYPVHLIRASVQRNVSTTLMRMLGSTTTTVKTTAMAAIIDVFSPVPIIVTHPTISPSKPTRSPFYMNGNPTVQICGGPPKSIQVNSTDAAAAGAAGAGTAATLDLRRAGPNDDGKCNTGTGADIGVYGGPATSPFTFLGGTKPGKYLQPASPILDPLRNVTPPNPATLPTPPAHSLLGNGVSGCPASTLKACQLYSPGLYPTGINGDNSTPIFKPGIYYIQNGGMICKNNCSMYMATGFTDGVSGTNTGWNGTKLGGGMMVYNTGSGAFDLGANGSINLVGSLPSSSYKGILFFQDRTAAAQTHSLGGGGSLSLVGTIYLTNTLALMKASASQYQALTIQGNAGNTTLIDGEIIVGTLELGGGGTIQMDLNPFSSLIISQVALVN